MVDALIVWLTRNGVDDLKIAGDADAPRMAVRMCEEPVIITTAATEAASFPREGKPWDEDDVERADPDWLTEGLRLPDVHDAALEISHVPDLAWE